jgi:hypothetical protein
MFRAEDVLLPLQRLQQRHDEVAHRDILNFDLYKRLKHMVLHFYKYAGKVELARQSSDKLALRRILMDAFIICMASANALNVSLGAHIDDLAESLDVDALANSIARRFPVGDVFGDALQHLVLIGGRMAKAIESSDHMEDGNPRSEMNLLVPELAVALLAVCSRLGVGLESDIRIRLAAVEGKSIFAQRER